MAVVDVLDINGDKLSEIDLEDSIFNVPVKKSILHQVVTMQLAGRRAGTASVKRRSDVKGSGRKLYRQKGTGNARPGDIKTPLRRGGGVVFGPDPKSYAYKVPKKVRKQALKMALSDKLKNENLLILNNFDLDEIKTRKFINVVDTLGARNALIITDRPLKNLELSSGNVPGFKVLRAEGLNVYDILKYQQLLLLEPSLNQIKIRLS
ncbi:Large ribosomal subunit protein uL4 [Candidatus Magnetomoraceae bacterium gMMP-15]